MFRTLCRRSRRSQLRFSRVFGRECPWHSWERLAIDIELLSWQVNITVRIEICHLIVRWTSGILRTLLQKQEYYIPHSCMDCQRDIESQFDQFRLYVDACLGTDSNAGGSLREVRSMESSVQNPHCVVKIEFQ